MALAPDNLDTILIFGMQIGVDWPTEPLFLPLVEKALYALPFLFELSIDQETKAPFFYDRSKGQSFWYHPRRDEYRNLLKELREEHRKGADELEAVIRGYMTRIQIRVEEETDELKVSFGNVRLDQLFGLIMKGSQSVFSGKNKTFLIIDPYEAAIRHFRSDPTFAYVVLDARKMHLDLNVRKLGMVTILEEARRTLVHSMMKGRVLVVHLGLCCVDFLNTFHDEAVEELPRKLNFERSLEGISLSYLPQVLIICTPVEQKRFIK